MSASVFFVQAGTPRSVMSKKPWEPLVSVIIPAYNAATYIAQTLEAAVHQTYSNFEIILVDDGSDDADLLEREIHRFGDRVRYLTQPNGGPSSARNTGIRAARGPLVAFLDSDDIWESEFLVAQIDRFRSNPDLDLVWSNCCRQGAVGGDTIQFDVSPPSRPVTFESLIRLRNIVVTSTTVAKKETIVAAGLFDESMRWAEDFDLWLRVAARGAQFDFIETVLARRRQRPTGLSADIRAMSEGASIAYDNLANALGEEHPLIPLVRTSSAKLTASYLLRLGKNLMDDGEWEEAIQCVSEANKMVRTGPRSLFLGLARISVPAAIAVARLYRGRVVRTFVEK